MASPPIKMNVNAAPVEPAANQTLLGIREDGELVQVEVDLNVVGVPAGAQGQLVGYGADGKPVAVAAPTTGDPYDDAELVQALAAQGQRVTAVEQFLGSLPGPVDLTPVTQAIAAQGQRLSEVEQTVSGLPEPVDVAPIVARIVTVEEGLPALTARVAATEEALANLPEGVDLAPLTARVAAVEEGLEAVAQPYDDAPIKTELAQLKARVDQIDGAPVNRPPTSSPIPTQILTVGTPFSFSAAGYYSDPDNHALNALEVSGTLPPGIVQDGFSFTGTPTTAGNYTVTLIVEDLYGAQTSRSISWQVAAVAGSQMKVAAAPGGYTLQNPGTFRETTITPAVGGYTLEFV